MPSALLVVLVTCCVPFPVSAAAGAGQCVDASSEEMRGEVSIGMVEGGFLGPLQVKPGDRRTLALYVRQGPAWWRPKACVTWSLATPEVATLVGNSGALEVKENARHLAAIRVRGSLVGSTQEYTATLVVFRPESNPLAGMWRETAQLRCRDTPGSVAVRIEEGIREFEVDAVGNFSVTWRPFESYHDYWGTYKFDLEKKTVEFVVRGGNAVPADFSGNGSFSIKPDRSLELQGVWLGTHGLGVTSSGMTVRLPPGEEELREYCGHIFAGKPARQSEVGK